ncbi:MAG: lytic transglycosylase domain-containing protein [Solirubrobacterales bacterium]|nr:lytic transglycosylase domain-containing protein [Solirubrobacterales bacterium]
MASNRTSAAAGRRTAPDVSPNKKGSGAMKAIFILLGIIAVGIVAILLLSDVFQRGIQEVRLPLRHENVIRQQAEEKNVDASLIAAVIYSESKFSDATSSAGARGLMQITPETAAEIEKLSGGSTFEIDDLSDPELNIRYGTFYLRHLLNIYDDDPVAALAAYNAGPANAGAWGGSNMTIDDIEFPETKAYVKKVLEKQREYRHAYDLELGY